MIKKINLKKMLDIFIVILLFFTCIKKGGFYKNDVLTINLIITAIGIIYLAITTINDKKSVVSIASIFSLLLAISYFLPILFDNYADMSDSIFEMVRYFNLYIVYKIVSESDNKKIYEKGIVVITLIECIIGIDGIGNRYLAGLLNFFKSGYLSKDFTRISGTIQYANVFAMLCAISLFILLFKVMKKNKYNFINASCFYFILTSLILTQSRAVMAIFIVFLVYYIISSYIKRKENIKEAIITLVFNFIFSIICATLIYNFAMCNGKIYVVTAIMLFINVLLNILLYKYNKVVDLINIKKLSIALISGIIVYFIIAINIDVPLYISSSNENSVSKNIYNEIRNGENNIKFKVDENEIDTRYKIKFIQVLNNLEVIEIKEVGYFSSSTGSFDFNFELDEDVKYINMVIECEKGNITLKDMELNGNKVKLNYLLIPSSIIEKAEDFLNGTTSISDRITFSKDAIKIITASIKNFVLGTGGEGFKNTYELYQSQKYISTEVHNSFLQIFVESGIIGFSCILVIILYTLIKCKDKEKRLLLLFFIIHSLVDLELSYFSMIFLFGILLGLCANKEEFKIKISNFLYVPIILVLVVIFYIVFKANLAYSIKIQENTGSSMDKEASIIKNLEKRVMLDKYDVNYRIELNKEYEKYLKLLVKEYSNSKDKVLEEEIKNVISNIKINADIMMKNSKNNKYVIINVSNTYFNNLFYFTKLYYQEDTESGYEEYMNYIINNVESLKNHKYNEVAINEVNELYESYYLELKEKNKSINSLKIQDFIDILKEKKESITII